jgi:hypothetical protein
MAMSDTPDHEMPGMWASADLSGGWSDAEDNPGHPYAMTRLDALRQLRREGYAVVEREPYMRWRKATVDDPTCVYHEAEQMHRRLVAAELIITMAAYSGSYEGEMLERMWAEAEAWLDQKGDPHGLPTPSVPDELPDTRRAQQPWEFFDGD